MRLPTPGKSVVESTNALIKQETGTLFFQVKVAGIDVNNMDYASIAFEAGCGDALVFLEDGALFVDFDREAISFDSAINSAIAWLAKAGGSIEAIHNHTTAD